MAFFRGPKLRVKIKNRKVTCVLKYSSEIKSNEVDLN
jgi:hypothetical protein